MKLLLVCVFAIFTSSFAFPRVEEFEIVENELEQVEKEFEDVEAKTSFFELVSKIVKFVNMCHDIVTGLFMHFDLSTIQYLFRQREKILVIDRDILEPSPKRATRLESFSWKDCGGANAMVNINSVSITPDPVKLPGPLNIATNFKIVSNLDTPLKGTVLLYKEVAGKFVKIPCIDNLGSCTYDDLCELLEEVECPDPIVKIGIDCLCPLKAGSYSLPKTDFDVEVESIPAGTYHALGNATMNGKEGACLDITLTLA